MTFLQGKFLTAVLTLSVAGTSACVKSKLSTKVAAGGSVNCDSVPSSTSASSTTASCDFKASATQANTAGSAAVISWTKPDKANGSVTYKIYKSTDNSLATSSQIMSKATVIAEGVTGTEVTATALTPASTVYFYVIATDAKNRIFVSAPVTFSGTPGAPVPGGSGTLTIPGGSITTTSMTIQWSEATAADGTNNVTYDVYQSTSNNMSTLANTLANGTRLTTPSLTAGTTSYTATGLLPTMTYYFTVVVTDAYGNQSIYTTASGSTTADTTPPTVGGGGSISFAGVTATGFTANWTAATDDINTAAQLEYRVYYSTSNNITTAANAVANGTAANNWTANITTLPITGLNAGTTYYVNVVVRDTTGNMAGYTSSSQATSADAAPTAGNSGTLSYTSVGATSVTVNWTTGTDDVTAASSLQYRVYYSTSNNIGSVANATANGTPVGGAWTTNISTLNVTGLAPGTTYYFQVLIRDGANQMTAYTSSSQATTGDSTPPTVSNSTLSYSAANATGFTVSWTAASDNVTAGASLQYIVYTSATNNITTPATAAANGTAANAYTANITTLAVTGLSPSTTYYVQVLVRDAAGNVSAYASTSTTTTIDSTAPTPGNSGTITYSSVAAGGFTANWTAASDNVTAAASLEYRVYYSLSNNITNAATAQSNGTAANNWTANITTLAISGLGASTTYYVQVLVRDAAGNTAAYTSSSQATTADSTAPTPGNSGTLSYSGVTSSIVNVNWTAATDNVTAAASLQYIVYYSTSNNITTVATAQANGTVVNAWTSNLTSYPVSGLSASTTYYFQVLVRDAANNISAYTSSSQATSAGGAAGSSNNTDRTIFTSNTTLDGLAMGSSGSSILVPTTRGADVACNSDATAGSAGLPTAKWDWNALVGINGYSIRNRFNLPTSGVKFTSTLFPGDYYANSESDLFTAALLRPMNVAANGASQAGWTSAWTGKNANWTSAQAAASACNDWSSNSMTDTGYQGDPSVTTAGEWRSNSALASCNAVTRIYCISTPPAYIFVTSTTHTGNLGGEAGADSICQTRGTAGSYSANLGVHKWRAVIARLGPYSGMTARQGLSLPHNTKVYLVDNTTQVADTSSRLFNDSGAPLLAEVSLDENGATVATADVWVGDTSNNCADFTSALAGSTAVKGDNQFGGSLWLSNGTATCDNAYRLYCIGQ